MWTRGISQRIRRHERAVGRWLLVFLATVLGALMLASPAHAQDEGIKTARINVQNETIDATGKQVREPVPGVRIEVLDEADGSVLGEGVTNEKGQALFDVPLRERYIVRLDESTLPEGVSAGAAGTEIAINAPPLQTFTTNFFTGERVIATQSLFDKVAQRMVDGARLGLIIAITSVGLSLIFGTTGLTNFAHGEMVTFGGMVAFLFNVTIGIPLLIAGPVTVFIGGLFGYFLDWGLWGRLRKRGVGLVSQLVVSVGLSLFLRFFFLYRFGGRTRPLADYSLQEAKSWGPVSITPRDFTTALISLIVLVGVGLALQLSRMGKAIRAVSDNPDLASATGINSKQVIRLVWFVGGALAAMGGIFRGLDEQVGFEMGANLLFLMFAGITLGGLGSAYGALVGGFIIGMFVELATVVNIGPLSVPSELKNVPPLLILVIVLLVRPQGILGRKQRVG
jgi:branched-chain amino acid transport system permease protein